MMEQEECYNEAENISYILNAMERIEACWQTESITSKMYCLVMAELALEIHRIHSEEQKKEAE